MRGREDKSFVLTRDCTSQFWNADAIKGNNHPGGGDPVVLIDFESIRGADGSPGNQDRLHVNEHQCFPIEFARRKGFFREEGLNIVMIVMRTNVIMNALLTSGIDYGTPATSVIRAAANDLPVKAVAVLTGGPTTFSLQKKNSSPSEISKANGLRGL